MKYFLFDIGNVLADHDADVLDQAIAKSSSLPWDQACVRTPDLDDMVERGKISDEEYVAQLSRSRGVAWTVDDLTNVWARVFTLNPAGRKLFEDAKQAGVEVYTLSNIAEFHINAIERKWPDFFEGTKGLFLSYQIGVRKPHPDIYRYVLQKLNADGDQCFFIDDLPQNVIAARKFDINAYHFIPENHDAVREVAKGFFGW